MTWQQTIDDEREDAYEEGLAEGPPKKPLKQLKTSCDWALTLLNKLHRQSDFL